MAGAAGFEPTDGEIKTRCLTTWRRPYYIHLQVKIGRGGWIRTNGWRDQNPLPYHLATPLLHTSTGENWQGRLDSNQRMARSKPAALPLGDAPNV